MEFEEEGSEIGEEYLEEMLDDLVTTDQSNNFAFAKRDCVIFVIDCSGDIMNPLPGEERSEFDKIMESYANFMMSKIIANCSDRVGMIFYNVGNTSNSLNFQHIFTVHELDCPTAKIIKSVPKIKDNFEEKFGRTDQIVPLHQVFWLFGQEIKDCQASKNHLRLFLFTANDCPYPENDDRIDQAVNHARQLSSKFVHIELFPIRSNHFKKFEIRKFYHEIITYDSEDVNPSTLDCSEKILDLQTRIRQKQFKKRTLNRLLMQIGKDSHIGIKIFSMYCKARRPLAKKLEASTNKGLKRVVKRLNQKGQILFNQQIGNYFPLGGQKIILKKEEMNKVKGIRQPGIYLIGFKPKKLIKPYHNLRPSYFLYPDEQHVSGSTQFIDALLEQLTEKSLVAIVSIVARANQQFRFAALFPQTQQYDTEDHHQNPPGFHMVVLPFADDIVNFNSEHKTSIKPMNVSCELIKITKLLINNLTVKEFDFRDFQNPALQKFYSHLQAHALNEPLVEDKVDTMQPDLQGMQRFSDVIALVKDTAEVEIQNEGGYEKVKRTTKKAPKMSKKEKSEGAKKQESRMQVQKTSKVAKRQPKKKAPSQQFKHIIAQVQNSIQNGAAWNLDVGHIMIYLKQNNLSEQGQKGEMVDRIMKFISIKSQI